MGGDASRTDGHAAQVIRTGVPNLDAVLGGGIRRGAIAMIVGLPGTGKTIMAQQIAFAQARAGDAVLYLTGYAETPAKMLSHDAAMTFFDPSLIGDRVHFVSLADLLKRGATATEKAILDAARTHGARLLVLDGFAALRRLFRTDESWAGFVYSVGSNLTEIGATILVLLEGDPDERGGDSALTVCDVVLTLRQVARGTWDRRLLHVMKVRGAASLNGIHPFTISGAGIQVHPRFESVAPRRSTRVGGERAGFGVPALDAVLGGGLTAGTATLVAGSPGTGKTLLGLHLLAEGARRGERGLMIGFLESPEQLRDKVGAFGIDLAAAEQSGLVRLMVYPGYDADADRIGEELRADVEGRGVRRLVIDSATELEHAIYTEERKVGFLAALVDYVRGRGMTGYLSLDVPTIIGPELHLTGSPLSAFAENLILLRQTELDGAMHRIFTVLKMRFSEYDPTITEYTIRAGRGVEVIGPAPPAEGLLTGVARSVRRQAGGTGTAAADAEA
jgi:circadian clock protein KaiC